MRSTFSSLPLSLALAATFATPAVAQTPVPRGGTTIDIGPGGKFHLLSLQNTTGQPACDVTLTVFGAGAPNITDVDVQGIASDRVDDDDDGSIGGANENDTTDSSPGTTCRSIFGNAKMLEGATAQFAVTFSDNLPATAKLKVRFSTEVGGRHYDLCAAADLDAVPALTDVPVGTHLANFLAVNLTPNLLNALHVMTPLDLPIVDVVLPPPFDQSSVQLLPDLAIVQLPLPIPPGQSLELNVALGAPAADGDALIVRPGPAVPNAGVPYGQGCAGSGGYVPELHVAGVPMLGGSVTLWIDDALGGSNSLMLIGLQPTQIPIGGGCDLLVSPILNTLPLPLTPGGPGDGGVALGVPIPPAPSGIQLHLQALTVEPGSALGFATTNGVTLTFP
ncbi:MAG: hypothetical protein ACF8XB_15715 [Planctomycetota bacterium JB042]